MHKVLMFGDRSWSDYDVIDSVIIKLIAEHGTSNLLIIEGGAAGADQISGHIAHSRSVHVAEVKALWDTRGRSAGPQRNEIMKLIGPDEGIGFHPDISKSRGTKDMMIRLKRAGIPVEIIDGK